MTDVTFQVELVLPRRAVLLGLAVLALCLGPREVASESLTLTSYYPAPSAVYDKLVTTGDTWLARSGGAVAIGTTNTYSEKLHVPGAGTVSGMVGVGVAPSSYQLDINPTGSDLRVSASGLELDLANSGGVGSIKTSAARLIVQGGDTLYVTSGGVGINNSQPYGFDVNGHILCRSGSCSPAAGTP